MASMNEGQFQEFLQTVNANINDNEELFVAIAALVISIVALLASLLQVAQQYYASAAGYSSCDKKVIGQWSDSKKRILKPYEFRFEVQFEAPVIFLCPPSNKNGPVKQQPIYRIDGSKESLAGTRTELKAQDQAPKPEASKSDKEIKESVKQEVHTADNELASWVMLLAALQQMERDSRAWQHKKYEDKKKLQQVHPPRDNAPVEEEDIEQVLEKVTSNYTLTVAVQRKLRSWDTMPSTVKKPYATTTWCHVVEMLALLGVYWVEFDRTNNRYRGEGNGYTVTGDKVSDLGIMFTFQVHGGTRFQANRVIPVDEVKELCFGFVPTIYKSKSDHRRLKFPSDESRDMSILNFSSKHEIAETLVLIGCNTNTVNYFSDKTTARVTHLFPIAFEIVGMLARTLHIEKSAFRRLPNPTLYRWDTKNFSLPRLFMAYAFQMQKLYGGRRTLSNVTKQIWRHIEDLRGHIDKLVTIAENSSSLNLPLMDALHKALDDMDEILTFKKKERPPLNNSYTNTSNLNRIASEKLSEGPAESRLEGGRRELVQEVLRSHIQAVLSGLNKTYGKPTQESPGNNPVAGPGTKTRFEALDAASPELKQDRLMEVYFRDVLQRKIKQPTAPPGFSLRSTRRTGMSTRTALTADDSDEEMVEEWDDQTDWEELPKIQDDKKPIKLPDMAMEVTREDIWCTLVFRMICWLMLHDFHKKDVQNVSKSELFGSRLPVYIA